MQAYRPAQPEQAVGLVLLAAQVPGALNASPQLALGQLELAALQQHDAQAKLGPDLSGPVAKRSGGGQRPGEMELGDLIEAEPLQHRKGASHSPNELLGVPPAVRQLKRGQSILGIEIHAVIGVLIGGPGREEFNHSVLGGTRRPI